ncbi:hypothetical protein cypCar_00044198 [Cyprinus carpio]|nr:hypothetical protein cypCar_00044198 [Cyprinus carpio]
MIISTVSKSHEGFYSCKHPERGESPKSWISVTASSRRSGSDDLSPVIAGVTAGLIFFIVFLVFLWCYRSNKGGRSESLSRVSQQQNSRQTSEQNQSEAGNKTLMSDVTYAEIEFKPTEKQKENKERFSIITTDRQITDYFHSPRVGNETLHPLAPCHASDEEVNDMFSRCL